MAIQVGTPSYTALVNTTKKATEANSQKGKDISKEELSSIVQEIQKSGATAEEATIVINDTLKKQGSTQTVKLTTQDINNATTFSFKVGGKSNSSQTASTQSATQKPTTTKSQSTTKSTTSTQKPTQATKPNPQSQGVNKNTNTKYEVEASFQLNKPEPPKEEPKVEQQTPKEDPKVEQSVQEKEIPEKKEVVENKTTPTTSTKTPPKTIKHHKKKDLGDRIEDKFEDIGRDLKKAGREIKKDLKRAKHKIFDQKGHSYGGKIKDITKCTFKN